jgi:transcriptional regulator with XRE-family HTH domain
MAGRAIEIGDVGTQLATTVAELRKRRGWDQKRLAELVTEAGRQMSASMVGKIEGGGRRVDVDDLVALAFALEVSPARLLLSAHRDPDDQATDESSDPDQGPGPVTLATRDDIDVLGDLEGLEGPAPTLAAIAVRLAQECDKPVSQTGPLHQLSKELRSTLMELRALLPEEPPSDDGLDDLASPD